MTTRTACLMIHLDESAHAGHQNLAAELVRRAHAGGLAGATVLRGVEGYGASSHVHTTRVLSLSDDLPMVVLIVDDEERLREFARAIVPLLTGGLVTIAPVEVLHGPGGAGPP